jgi:hypothetical protein
LRRALDQAGPGRAPGERLLGKAINNVKNNSAELLA